MTKSEFSVILTKISRFYPKFYEGQDAEKVRDDWYEMGGFENISFEMAYRAVKAFCNTSKFPPSLADIKTQMVESYLQDKPTAMQAFQRISSAVKKSTSRDEAVKQYNDLPPILRKLVEDPSVLRDWNHVSTEAFQTVIMSAIRESYRELTTREAKYYAFPDDLQQAEQWRISTSDLVALPEPEPEKTVDDLFTEMDRIAEKYRIDQGIEANPEYANRVTEFLKPLTDNELKEIKARQKRKEDLRMEMLKDE